MAGGNNGFHRYSHGHTDLVLAVSHNTDGTRAATASSDHRVKVWERDEASGQWSAIDTWIAHDAEVTDIRWTGPYVGEHLGTISEDGLLRIWQEDGTQPPHSGRRFRKLFEQVTATGVPYMCLDFKTLGTETYLAAVTRDGYLSVFEPQDHDDLSAWQVMWSDYLCKYPSRMDETAFRLSWHKERVPAWPAVVAGLDRKSLGLAVAVGDMVKVFRTDRERKFYIGAVLDGARALVRDVAWANGSMRGYDLLATASKDGFVRIYELHTPAAVGLPTSSFLQQDPHIARRDSDHLQSSSPAVQAAVRSGIGAGLAAGARGRRDEGASVVPGAIKQDAKLVAELEVKGGGTPWRVSWSPLGDVLIASGDDGAVRLWKKAVDGKWLEAAEINATRGP